ncbi:hypothetical protein K439DRAFT_1611252 [Ramaria rubella]|nr:hypothetical protein K439DRAFT_1611252 [Ramaria rubella]
MYQHETSEDQLDQLATDSGPVDNAICFIKRQVWPHGSLLSYEVPENPDQPCFKALINLETPTPDDVQKKKKKSSSASRKCKREPSPTGSTLTEHAKMQKWTGSQSLGPDTTRSSLVNPLNDTYPKGTIGHLSQSLRNIGMGDVSTQDIPMPPSPSLQATSSAPSRDEVSKGATPSHSPHSGRDSGEEQSDEDEEDELNTPEVVFQFQRQFEVKSFNSQQKSNAPTRQLPLLQPITSQANDALIDQESGHSQQAIKEALQASSHQDVDKQPPPPSKASPGSRPRDMVEKSNVSPQNEAMDVADPPLTDPKNVDQTNIGDDDDVDMDLEMSQTSQSGKGGNDPASDNSSSLTEGSPRVETP